MRNFTGALVQGLDIAALLHGGGVFYDGTEITSHAQAFTGDVRFPLTIHFDPSTIVPTGPDNAPGSISVSVYIAY
jgi:hypothetical protein